MYGSNDVYKVTNSGVNYGSGAGAPMAITFGFALPATIENPEVLDTEGFIHAVKDALMKKL